MYLHKQQTPNPEAHVPAEEPPEINYFNNKSKPLPGPLFITKT